MGVEVDVGVGVGLEVGVGVREGVSVGVEMGEGLRAACGSGVAAVRRGVGVKVKVGLTAPWPEAHPALSTSAKKSKVIRAPANTSARFSRKSIASGVSQYLS